MSRYTTLPMTGSTPKLTGLARLLIILVLHSPVAGYVSSQPTNNRFFSSGYEIVADVLPENDIYFSHVCDKGITIYNLAEIFQVNAESVLALNKLKTSQPVNSGRIVKIPLEKDLIVSENAKTRAGMLPVPLYYVVKRGESMFRIARKYFDKEVSDIRQINKKKDNSIREGEKLLIGWYLTRMPQVKPTKSTVNSDAPAKKGENTVKILPKTNTSDTTSIIKYYISDAIGYWDRNAQSGASFFVLHNEARTGSLMDIYNPMLRRHIKAKVIGKIPQAMYREDIEVILSAAAARELGILDLRFKVNLKYEK